MSFPVGAKYDATVTSHNHTAWDVGHAHMEIVPGGSTIVVPHFPDGGQNGGAIGSFQSPNGSGLEPYDPNVWGWARIQVGSTTGTTGTYYAQVRIDANGTIGYPPSIALAVGIKW